MFVTIYSNRFKGFAQPLCNFFPYYAVWAAYNLPIMHNGTTIHHKNDVYLQKNP